MRQRMLSSGWPYFAALSALILLLVLTERQLDGIAKENVGRTLGIVLETTQGAVRVWTDRQKINVSSLAQLPEIRQDALALLEATSESDREIHRKALREYLGPLVTSHGYLGFSIITPEGIRVGSMQKGNLGSATFIARMAPEYFKAVLAGGNVVTQPLLSNVPLIDASGHERSKLATMFALAPIRSMEGTISGVLALRINPLKEFSAIFARGRSGVSGETYGFDKNGNMLSESRFQSRLVEIDLLESGEASTLNIAIRYPGKNLLEQRGVFNRQKWPLTKMAASATKGLSGQSLEPYPDYRGVPVVGVWLWDDILDFGITTEIDAEEAFESLNTSKSAVRLFAFVVLVLLVILFLLQQKNNKITDEQKRALNTAKNKAEAANRAKMEFLSAMSHDLRTPLNAVIGFSQLLGTGLAKKSEYETYLNYIVRSGAHLLNLLNEVLEFAKLDIGELSFSISKHEPKSLVTDSLSMVQELADANKITMHLDSDLEELPLVWADNTRACQVLVNLLTNAIKYNREGGQVHVTVNHDGQHLQFAIRDTGAGIARQKMKSLWEPFNRMGAEKTVIEGSGIGLAFAKAIVEGLSGKIGVESTEGVGSCFWFTLPIAQEKHQAPGTETPVSSSTNLDQLRGALEGTRVLLIDEFELDRIIVEEMLKYIDGLSIVSTGFGREGLERLKESEFDIILVSTRLTDMDGFTWNLRRDQMGLAFGVPVIAISADVTTESKQKAIMDGFVDFVEKPVILENLITAMVASLEKKDDKTKGVTPLSAVN